MSEPLRARAVQRVNEGPRKRSPRRKKGKSPVTEKRNVVDSTGGVELGLNRPQLAVYTKIVSHVDDLAAKLQKTTAALEAQSAEAMSAAKTQEREHADQIALLEGRIATTPTTAAITSAPALAEELRLAKRTVRRLKERSRVGREAAFDAMREAILADAREDVRAALAQQTAAHNVQLAAVYQRLIGGDMPTALRSRAPSTERAALIVEEIERHAARIAANGTTARVSADSERAAAEKHAAAVATLRGEVKAARGALAREQQERRAHALALQKRCAETVEKMHDTGVHGEEAAMAAIEEQRAVHAKAVKAVKRELRRALKTVASLEQERAPAAAEACLAGGGASAVLQPAASPKVPAHGGMADFAAEMRALQRKHAEELAAQSAVLDERTAAVVEAQLDAQHMQQKVQQLAQRVRRMSPKHGGGARERRASHNAKVKAAVEQVSRQYAHEVSRLRSELTAVAAESPRAAAALAAHCGAGFGAAARSAAAVALLPPPPPPLPPTPDGPLLPARRNSDGAAAKGSTQ